MTRNYDADESELVGKTTTAADELAELTGRDREEFEYDGEIPQFEDQEMDLPCECDDCTSDYSDNRT